MVSFIDRGIDHLNHRWRDVGAYAIALNKWDNRLVRYLQCVVGVDGNFFTVGRLDNFASGAIFCSHIFP